MKKIKLLVVSILLGTSIALVGCGNKVEGTYKYEIGTPDEILIVVSDLDVDNFSKQLLTSPIIQMKDTSGREVRVPATHITFIKEINKSVDK